MLGVGAAIVMLFTACSSSTKTSSPSATSGHTASGKFTDAMFNDIATHYLSPPPTSGPPPAKNKTVWWMGCGNSVPACKLLSDQGAAAAKLLGWSFHVADGNLNQNGGYSTAKPDALVVQGMDCSVIEQPLAEAKAQGVPVLGVQSVDCSAETPGAPSLIPIQVLFSANAQTLKDYFASQGANAAKYLIAVTGGKAQVIANLGKGGFYDYMDEGFLSTMAACSGCKVLANVQWVDADTAPNGPWIRAFTVALAKNPTVNGVFIPFDSLATTTGGLRAIKDSGLKPTVVGGNGNDPQFIQAIRDGDVTACTAAQDFRWLSYGAMDELNRYFNHQPSVLEGIGPTVVDLKHNLPPAGEGYTSNTWLPSYTKLWSGA
jgi:ribose transport system substrate-binding protein